MAFSFNGNPNFNSTAIVFSATAAAGTLVLWSVDKLQRLISSFGRNRTESPADMGTPQTSEVGSGESDFECAFHNRGIGQSEFSGNFSFGNGLDENAWLVLTGNESPFKKATGSAVYQESSGKGDLLTPEERMTIQCKHSDKSESPSHALREVRVLKRFDD